ncbi:hypothetical protein PPL_05522 [Heterostelium album PN500]|uniref:Ankyrin repeat protein n=1 Tax=Heterostelium pallidum (strain ATCC 26659 / Pp 5 / PN500) TaxID=670386 RepID=D3BAE6_HETP5|nr:hypothetical protein PPL_05522 [Heterostelium album PN500]EFA81533.1 hypothetical protein PPL_05522 [Heterostelium album PN500]|eukprot:XP_020433650.1 hypothetical protein PPL_05522 [Heterostelium album PN500]
MSINNSINNLTYKSFSKVFNNIVIRNEIFNQVYSINKMLSTINTIVIRYNQLIKSPKALIGNDYLDLFIQYLSVYGDKNMITHYFIWSVECQNLRILQYLYALVSDSNDEAIIKRLITINLMRIATLACDISILEWMNQNNTLGLFKCPSEDIYLFLPKRPNGFKTMKWLHSNLLLAFDETVVYSAAASGRMEIIIWALENHKGKSTDWIKAALDAAANNGNVPILEWINEHHRPSDTQLSTIDIVYFISKNKRCDTLDWIHKNWTAVNFNHNYDSVARTGSLELIRWIHENLSATNTEPLFTLEAMNNAACFNSLEVVKFLLYNRTEGRIGSAIFVAATNGRKDIVEFLLSQEYEINSAMHSFTIEETERKGYTHIATLLREKYLKNLYF